MITSQLKSDLIFKKHLSLKYATNNRHYEAFRKTMEASPLLYSHDFDIYNDDINSRHLRNQRQINYLKKLLEEGKMVPQMLKFNTFNTFYPSFILDHHFTTFLPIITKARLNKLSQLAIKAQIIGAFLIDRQSTDCSLQNRDIPRVNEDGNIEMDKLDYFYSTVSNPYLSHCIFKVSSKDGNKLALIQLKNANGQFKKQIKIKDFGSTASSDYVTIGFNFAGAKPIALLEIDQSLEKKIKFLAAQQKLSDFQYSLRDFQKSLWLTIKYTNMRRQFSTIEKSKDQRKIITYQAVASRIIKAFAQYMAFVNLNQTINDNPQSMLILEQVLASAHHIILQQLIHLRECCGGFGYMQFSGHPGCIERVAFRASLQKKKQLKLSPLFIQVTQYYTSSQQAEKYYSEPASQSISYMGYFGFFIGICANMRKNHQNMNYLSFKREFLKQSSIFSMHIKQQYSKHRPDNVHSRLHQYLMYTYILQHPFYSHQKLIGTQKIAFYQRLEQFQNHLIRQISSQLVELGQTLELSYLRNTIVGRDQEELFYSELVKKSKNNLRSSDQYRRQVTVDIVKMLNGEFGRL